MGLRWASSLVVATWLGVAAAAPQQVLVIHSYHPGFSFTDREQRGIVNGFRAAGIDVELQVEYLDAKRHPRPDVRDRVEQLLATKLAGTRYPVVLATDNAALEFALRVRPRLFPDAAVIFCGFNGPPGPVVQGQRNVTGVLERWDPGGTLRAIARMQPEVRSILVVHDATESGLGTRADLSEVLPEFRDRFAFELLPPEPREATLARVEQLPDGWAVLLMGYNVDSAGAVLDSAASGRLLAEHARVPVYTMDETRFTGGVVGGSLLTGEGQGAVAAGMAARVLAGTPVDRLPIVRDPVAVLRFDDRALRRFGIARAALPPRSEVLNGPIGYYQRHPVRVIGLAVFVASLMVLSTWLAIVILRRRRAEERLRTSEENLRVTLDSIGDGVMATDAHGSVTRMNPAAEALTGWTHAEALGRPATDVLRLVALDGGEAASPVVETLRQGKVVSLAGPCTLLARDGSHRQVADSAAPIRGRTGAVLGAVLVFRDITAEHALQEQLRQAQRMEVVGQLAGGVAHDFNNILTAILGAGQLLVEHLPAGSDDRGLADELVGAALRATELTRQLLAFSRKGAMQMRPVAIHRVIDEAVRLLSRSIEKRIAIERRLEARPDTLLGDPALLQSAILNLAVNGRDAMPEGGTLTFSTSIVQGTVAGPGTPPGDLLCVTVTDTGTGMDEAVRLRLFEPYFTTKPAGKGTGLGLASVYGCVRSHKGRIEVESEPGKGSSFRMLFPLLRGVELARAAPGDQVVHGRGRILVVDDEEIVRNAVARMLREMGYSVEVSGDAHEAVERYRRGPGDVDLVILDLVMPRLGGQEVFRLLRGIDPAARVLLASGFTEPQVTSELLAAGALGFIHKPVRMEELSRQVHAALGAGAARSARSL